MIFVVQGSYAVSSKEGEVIQTLLGSCVATCLHDPVARVGGMNHFLLPGDHQSDAHSLTYGAHAMEMLVDALLRLGARRDRLQAKLFGGGRMTASGQDIGAQNGKFARHFLSRAHIACTTASLGGTRARKIRMIPVTGAVQQMFVEELTETPIIQTPSRRGGTFDLF